MAPDDLESAIHRVLPALNFNPISFKLDQDFLARARHRARPSALTLDDIADQLVFLGTLNATDPDAVAEYTANQAMKALSELLQQACERLIVVWEDSTHRAFAAAFSITTNGSIGRLLGSSWHPPESWPEPMIDPFKPNSQVMNEAIARLESVVRERREMAAFDSRLDRALQLVNLTLKLIGAEGQHTSDRPNAHAPDFAWNTWLDAYRRSVHDEWRRVRSRDDADKVGVMQPTADGPLSGLRVFLSYARPDATTLARPVHSALRLYGAYVWFDQEEPLEKTWLDVGLADKIGECDAYVMCASDEFVERAGYATQEVAWAVQQRDAAARTRHFLVVARPSTVLPSIVADWPLIELHGQSSEELARLLAEHLLAPVTVAPAMPALALMPVRREQPVLLRHADLRAMRVRVKHVRRFLEIDQDSVVAAAGGTDDTRHAAEIRGRLRRIGDGLDWAGTLADLDRWPEDSIIRDCRWRLACTRAVVGTRWPLSEDLQDPDDIAFDVGYVAARPVPVVDWPPAVGWGHNERRLALRYHAGLLRMLQELLRRGLFGGLLAVPSSTLDVWEAELPRRRRECCDALIAMRLQGLLSWKEEPPTWDELFRHWSKLLVTTGDRSWSEPAPAELRFLVTANTDDIAAVAAETTWYAAYSGGLALQSFTLRNSPTLIDVWTASSSEIEPKAASGHGRRLQIGLVANADGSATVRVLWAGFDLDSAAGITSVVAPEKLHQAISFSRR